MNKEDIKNQVQTLRKSGKTYSEIQKYLNTKIPKSTISYWCRELPLPFGYERKIAGYNKYNLDKARKIALAVIKENRNKYLESISDRNKHLINELDNLNTAKIALAMLYLGEGSKTNRASLMFGNSDPLVIGLFLRLLRNCYKINESKFRCTLQCRADQNIEELEKFWSNITKIPMSQFYKARIDPRTINRPSRKLNYKGVCRIDYFSADLSIELKCIIKTISQGL